MTNNISGKDPQLDRLLDSVRQDTPELSREELLALIMKSEDRPVGAFMRQNNTPPFYRRVVVMSIAAAIILTASYFLLYSSPEEGKSLSTKEQVGSGGPHKTEHQPLPEPQPE